MSKHDTGRAAYHAGLSAEEAVARHYGRLGHVLRDRRWRGAGGEIDLVFDDGDGVLFVEVKQSRDAATAASHLSARQIARLANCAAEYVGHMPKGQLTDIRFDVALVDGAGRIALVENALMA